MSFVGSDSWELRYQRNNKQSGLKNIRCFPACSSPHRLRGFCGSSIVFQPSPETRFDISFGEFSLKTSTTLQVGQTITQEQIKNSERVDDLFKPWHRGEFHEDGQLMFNKQKKGWHYSWVSNKHTSDSEHVFRVYLFESLGGTSFRCVAVYSSPAFTIFCRRRDKAGVERLPRQFQNATRCRDSTSESESDEDGEGEERPKPKRQPVKRARTSPQASRQPAALYTLTAAASQMSPVLTKSIAVQENGAVFRILAALTNVHDRKHEKPVGVTPATSKPTSPVTSPATPSTHEESSDDPESDLSKAINDCWDWVSSDYGLGDTKFFDDLFSQPNAKPIEEILIRLGQQLLKEDFSQGIEEAFANKPAGDESKRQVVRFLQEKLERFFQNEGTTLDRFDHDLMAQKPQWTQEKNSSLRLLFPPNDQKVNPIFQNPLTVLRPLVRVLPGSAHDFTGHWRRPASTLEYLEKVRTEIGFSWIESKLMLQMEQEFFIWFEGNTMFSRAQRKLAGCSTVINILDGNEYPYMQPSLLVPGSCIPAIGISNRSWATSDGYIHFLMTFTPEYRMLRSTKRSACGNRLESQVTLHRNESLQFPGVWKEVYSFPACAERVTSY